MNFENYSIRKAKVEDASLIVEAVREIAKIPGRLASRPEELHYLNFQEKISALAQSSSGIFLVVEKNDSIVAHGFLEPHKLAVTAHVAVLTLAIHEGHQGMGIGKMLMQELLAWARSNQQIEKVELQVRSLNIRAIKLYEGLGFVEEGRKTKRLKYGVNEYIDDIYMALWVGN